MNLDVLKIFRFRLREYRWDILLLFILGFFLIGPLSHLSYFPFRDWFRNVWKSDYDIFPLSLFVVKIVVWIIFFLATKWLLSWLVTRYSLLRPDEYGFNYLDEKSQSKKRRDPLTDKKFLKEFIFQGNIQLENGGLTVTNSHSGCLIKPTWNSLKLNRKWKNFRAVLEIKFPSQKREKTEKFKKYLGVVFRAQNFDDYLMLELLKEGNSLVVRPHIRINGDWDAPYLNPDFNWLPDIYKPRTNTIKLTIIVKDNIVVVKEHSVNRFLRWLIADHADPNLRRADNKHEQLSKHYTGEVYFRDKAGMFGFRNYGNELAVVMSLYISGKLTKEDLDLIDK